MNILILSVGTRVKIIEYFMEEFKKRDKDNQVIATDMSRLAPALYKADKHYIVPRITEPGYIDIILDICKKEKIAGVLTLIDPEISLLALNKEKFEEIGTKVLCSDYDICEMSLDKESMYYFLRDNGFKAAKTLTSIDEFEEEFHKGRAKFPVFVKPKKGSASINICKVDSLNELKEIYKKVQDKDELIIQEFLDGEEIGIDCYIDEISKEVISMFSKVKIAMRAGETDKSVSFKDEKLFYLIEDFVKKAGYTGQIDVDVFDVNGEYYISEVNPRFGGGYPHAYECGVNSMKYIYENLLDKENRRDIGNYEDDVYMLKYSDLLIKKFDK